MDGDDRPRRRHPPDERLPARARRAAQTPPEALRRDEVLDDVARGVGPDRHGRRRLPHPPQVGGGPPRARPARRDRQRRRGRARDDQGPLRDGAAPAPPARGAGRGDARSARSTRHTSTCARSTRPLARALARGDRGAARRAADGLTSMVVGAGSYVCGEESAMLESMEGRRGMPRLRPPFPAQKGYLGRPTLIDNVETLVHVAARSCSRRVGLPGAALVGLGRGRASRAATRRRST